MPIGVFKIRKPGSIRQFRETMRQIQRKLGWLAKNDATCCGITVAQCHALLEIGNKKSMTLVELAAALDLDTSTISRTIDGMVHDGIVARTISEHDRRCLNLVLTEKGLALFNEINDTYDQYYENIFRGIPEEKHAQVIESINLLAGALTKPVNKACCRKEPC